MKVRQLVVLSILFMATSHSFQLIFLDEKHPVYKDSTNLMLEHATNDFQYYYSCADRTSGYDLTAAPMYRYLNGINGLASIHTGGIFLQGRAHYKKLWVKANTMLGGISELFKTPDKTRLPARNSSFGGFDDLTVELGYDFYQVPKWSGHLSIFVLGGIPVNGQARSTLHNVNKDASQIKMDYVLTNNVRLGTGFYRLGAGLQSSAIFYCRDGGAKMLTFFTGFQWNYIFPSTFYHINGINTYNEPFKATIRLHPGNEFSLWDAINYNYYNWNFEIGVTAQGWGSFDHHYQVEEKPKISPSFDGVLTTSLAPIRNAVNPYLACTYGTTVHDNPCTIGLGISYEFDGTNYEIYSESNARRYKNFQGVQVWGNAAYSF